MTKELNHKPLSNQGFTLVELLIVVIILAILAAIVVPQFASTTDDAKVSALDSTLANMRAAIDLYYQQHGEYPGQNTAVPSGGGCTGTPGTGDASSPTTRATAFIEQLSMFTDSNGAACSISDGTFKFGPYLKKNILPKNPITQLGDVEIITTGDLLMTGSLTPATGWKFDVTAGKFIANDTNTDASGIKYDAH